MGLGFYKVEPGGSSGVALELSQRQLRELRLLGREWARYDRARQHRKWRPRQPLLPNKYPPSSPTDATGEIASCSARAWWSFAIRVELERIGQERERASWAFAARRARQITAYASAYRRRLTVPICP